MELKDSNTLQNLKDAFAGESRRIVVTCTSQQKLTLKVKTM